MLYARETGLTDRREFLLFFRRGRRRRHYQLEHFAGHFAVHH